MFRRFLVTGGDLRPRIVRNYKDMASKSYKIHINALCSGIKSVHGIDLQPKMWPRFHYAHLVELLTSSCSSPRILQRDSMWRGLY